MKTTSPWIMASIYLLARTEYHTEFHKATRDSMSKPSDSVLIPFYLLTVSGSRSTSSISVIQDRVHSPIIDDVVHNTSTDSTIPL